MTTISTAYPQSDIQRFDALRIDNLRLNPGDEDVTNLQITRGGPVVAGINVRTADILAALDATANADVKHRADAYEAATEAERGEREAVAKAVAIAAERDEWKARAEAAERHAEQHQHNRDLALKGRNEAQDRAEAAQAKATALAAERDRLLATIERIDAVRRDFYEVRGDWADPHGARALKAQMERAILGDPPFVLPTEPGVRFECKHHASGTVYLFETCVSSTVFYWEVEDCERYSAEDVMEQFTDHRLIGANQ